MSATLVSSRHKTEHLCISEKNSWRYPVSQEFKKTATRKFSVYFYISTKETMQCTLGYPDSMRIFINEGALNRGHKIIYKYQKSDIKLHNFPHQTSFKLYLHSLKAAWSLATYNSKDHFYVRGLR